MLSGILFLSCGYLQTLGPSRGGVAMNSRGTPFGLSFPKQVLGPFRSRGRGRPRLSHFIIHPLRSLNALAHRSTLTVLQDSQQPVSSLHLLIETAYEKPVKASVVPRCLPRLLTSIPFESRQGGHPLRNSKRDLLFSRLIRTFVSLFPKSDIQSFSEML